MEIECGSMVRIEEIEITGANRMNWQVFQSIAESQFHSFTQPTRHRVNKTQKMTAAKSVQKPLGKAGVVFFGSLCLGTFGLGVWQTKRYIEKVEMIEERDRRMGLPPTENVNATEGRIRLKGTFDHKKEFYVGPRSSPLSQSTGSLGVPQQGYFVWTPMVLTSVPGQAYALVNRGWVSREKVDSPGRRRAPVRSEIPNGEQAWSRPTGEVQVMAVQSKAEGTSI